MVSFMVYIDDHVYYSYNSFQKISRELGRKEITQNIMAIGMTIGGERHKELFFIHVVSSIYEPPTVRYPILVNNRVQFGK